MPLNAIYSPRGTHKLWPLPPGKSLIIKQTFKPTIIKDWAVPPLPTWNRKHEEKKKPVFTAQQLTKRAEDLRAKAQQLADNACAPNLREQLGQYLLGLESADFEAMIKRWQAKGKSGEVSRASMRVYLRTCIPSISSSDSDSLFDEWDSVHKDGALDNDELRAGLATVMAEAVAFNTRPDPESWQIDRLLQRAAVAAQAAEATTLAIQLEAEVDDYSRELTTRADVRLGALLQKRMITPGEFVTRFGKAGAPTNVLGAALSKEDFRRAVSELLAGRRSKRKSKLNESERALGSASRAGSSSSIVHLVEDISTTETTTEEVDAVFEMYDADGGGTLDMSEAKTMLKGLQMAGREAEQSRRRKELVAREQRFKATKKAALAMSEVSVVPPSTSFRLPSKVRRNSLVSAEAAALEIQKLRTLELERKESLAAGDESGSHAVMDCMEV